MKQNLKVFSKFKEFKSNHRTTEFVAMNWNNARRPHNIREQRQLISRKQRELTQNAYRWQLLTVGSVISRAMMQRPSLGVTLGLKQVHIGDTFTLSSRHHGHHVGTVINGQIGTQIGANSNSCLFRIFAFSYIYMPFAWVADIVRHLQGCSFQVLPRPAWLSDKEKRLASFHIRCVHDLLVGSFCLRLSRLPSLQHSKTWLLSFPSSHCWPNSAETVVDW